VKTPTKEVTGSGGAALPRIENGPPAKSDNKHDRILHAAIEVFAENGYFNSRISDIAKKADVADGTIYLYFKNKEQILMAAIDYAFTIFMNAAQKEMATIADPRERLARLAALHLESLGANRGLAMVFQTELRQSAKFLSEFSHRRLVAYFDLIRAVVRDGQASGQFRREVSDKIFANCFFGALDAITTSWLLSERDYNLGMAAEAIVDVVMNGMENRK
jgi:TetR/AcrR family fatty acid metabolism transcriptional regulator